jgi:hypothetical protein
MSVNDIHEILTAMLKTHSKRVFGYKKPFLKEILPSRQPNHSSKTYLQISAMLFCKPECDNLGVEPFLEHNNPIFRFPKAVRDKVTTIRSEILAFIMVAYLPSLSAFSS